MLTNRGDQTKNHVVLHVEHPTKPYQLYRHPVLAVRISLVPEPLPGVTKAPIWLDLHSRVVLPIITGRGVKYTHDIRHLILHPDSGPPGIRLISQASNQKKVVVGDGGAKHRSVDPPTDIPQCCRSPCRTRIHTVVRTPHPRRSWLATANTRAKQTILVKIS